MPTVFIINFILYSILLIFIKCNVFFVFFFKKRKEVLFAKWANVIDCNITEHN